MVKIEFNFYVPETTNIFTLGNKLRENKVKVDVFDEIERRVKVVVPADKLDIILNIFKEHKIEKFTALVFETIEINVSYSTLINILKKMCDYVGNIRRGENKYTVLCRYNDIYVFSYVKKLESDGLVLKSYFIPGTMSVNPYAILNNFSYSMCMVSDENLLRDLVIKAVSFTTHLYKHVRETTG